MTTKHWVGGWLVVSCVAACGDDSGTMPGTGTETETTDGGDDDDDDDDDDGPDSSSTEPDPDTSSTSADPDTSTGPDPDTSTSTDAESSSSSDGGPIGPPAEFFVRIENISTDSVLPTTISPGVWVEHETGSTPVFTLNFPDVGDGLVELAEDGDTTVLASNVDAAAGVAQSGTWDEALAPGEMVEFNLTAEAGNRLSIFTGVGRANDVFIGPAAVGVSLFTNGGEPEEERDITQFLRLYEVGSEFTQAPGQGPQQLSTQPAPNTGMVESGAVSAFASSTRALPQPATLLDVQVTQDTETDTFTITITNEGSTVDAPLSAMLWALHDDTVSLFAPGASASTVTGLEALAEDGDPSAWFAAIDGTAGITTAATIDTPAASGESFVIVVTPDATNGFLSIATSLAASNDAFIAPWPGGIPLLDAGGNLRDNDDVEDDFRRLLVTWDAGTEANEVPGVGANTQSLQAAPGDGAPDADDTIRPYSDSTNDLDGENAGGFLSVTIVNGGAAGEFDVTIENTSDTTAYPGTLSPPLYAVHDDTVVLFDPDAVASPAIEALAEDGDADVLQGDLDAEGGVSSVVVGPLALEPGDTLNFTVDATAATPFFSIASMVQPSNDTFVAFQPGGIRLVDDEGTPFTDMELAVEVAAQLQAWESGTEANQAGAIGRDQAPRQAAPNTGEDEGEGTVRFTQDDTIWAWPEANQIVRVTVGPTGA